MKGFLEVGAVSVSTELKDWNLKIFNPGIKVEIKLSM